MDLIGAVQRLLVFAAYFAAWLTHATITVDAVERYGCRPSTAPAM